MPEPKRDPLLNPDAVDDRISRAEALLDEGLDCYFDNRYEEAVHLWTRVLFLDRSHARARAYIDRARSALAERQRHSEQLIHESQALLELGETGAARNLLAEAVAAGGGAEDERSAALRVKLERHERASATPRLRIEAAPDQDVPAVRVRDGWSRKRWSNVLAIGLVLVVAVPLVGGVLTPRLREWLSSSSNSVVLSTAAPAGPLPVLSGSDLAMVRARTHYSHGRLADALVALERVSPDSSIRAEADALRMDIQRLLLAAGQERSRTVQAARGSAPR